VLQWYSVPQDTARLRERCPERCLEIQGDILYATSPLRLPVPCHVFYSYLRTVTLLECWTQLYCNRLKWVACAHCFEQQVRLSQKSQEKSVFLNIFSSLITTNIFYVGKKCSMLSEPTFETQFDIVCLLVLKKRAPFIGFCCNALAIHQTTFLSSQWRFQVNSMMVLTFQTSRKSANSMVPRLTKIHSRYKVHLEEGFDCILIIDGVPVINKSNLKKLLAKSPRSLHEKV
jgi:hypothetical protein